MPKAHTNQFANYARYYDLLYHGKEYVAETRFVHDRLKALRAKGRTLLELGCGTGRHAVGFAELGWLVSGVDLSPEMVAQARRRTAKMDCKPATRPKFAVGDIRNVRLGKTFDVVLSLFHVLGYQTSNRDLEAAFLTAATHLKPRGVLLFDFWFGPAVLTDRPSVRIKRLADKSIAVTRLSEPTLDVTRNLVSVDFDVLVEDRRTHQVAHIKETHHVRYFFLPELEHFLAVHGLKILAQGKWMGVDPLDSKSWYGWIAAQRA